MSPELIKALLRPLLGAIGGGMTFSDNDLTQLAGGVSVVVSLALTAYYEWRRKEEKEDAPPPKPPVKVGKRDR
jgi:hypothetical protein